MFASRHVLLLLILPVLVRSQSTETQCERKSNHKPRDYKRECGSYATKTSLDYENRINSGYRARPGQFPSYAEVHPTTQKGDTFNCGGTVIGQRHILTAAHCLPYLTDRVTVRFGPDRLDEGQDEEYKASDWCRASNYRSNYTATMEYPVTKFDVAIIELEKPVKFNKFIQPACLPGPTTPPLKYGEQQAYAIGLGQKGNTPVTSSADELQVLPVVRQKCPEGWKEPETLMCVKANKVEFRGIVCRGDSGGPLLALDSLGRQTVFGITSFAYAECLPLDNKLHNYTLSGWLSDVVNLMPEINKLLEECSSSSGTKLA